MEPRKIVDTLIIDLDNTIFDWFAVWYGSFKPIYDEILSVAGGDVDRINASIRRVHQKRRTSEYSFLIEEVDALDNVRADGDIRLKFKESIEESQKFRDKNLKLYQTVFTSLWEIKKTGTKIIAYTESMSFYSAYRLKRFGLDGVIDVLFSPRDHDIPSGISIDKMRRLPEDYYELQVTELRHTPVGELKPNPQILIDIIESMGASRDRCVYVGDSIFKDVAMARDVGVYDVHAEYGESQRRPEYRLLQDVSHWTEEDVQRERDITSKKHDFVPSITLKEVFSEIFKYFEFTKFKSENEKLISNDERRDLIDVWKKCIDVQQHFNDLEMRIRNFAITVVGALIASVSFTYQQGLQTELFGLALPTGVWLVAAAAFAWSGFFIMDRYWYHILLKGAVKHAAKIEKSYKDKIPGIDLGMTISESSGSVKFFCIKMDSDRRLTTFYGVGLAILIVIFCALWFAKRAPSPSIAGSPTHAVQAPAPVSAPKP